MNQNNHDYRLQPRVTKKVFCFTLVELLVVIAIIAVLSSLLTSSLRKTIEKADELICANRMKGVISALYMYCEDHDGSTVNTWNTIPMADRTLRGIDPATTWVYRPMWRTYILPDYLGGDTKGGPANFYFKNGWDIDECRRWNNQGLLECPTAVSSWGKGDLNYFSTITEQWFVGTGTVALNIEYADSYQTGARRVTNINLIENAATFGMAFCSATGWRGNSGASATGPFDMIGSGYAPGVGGADNPIPLFPHGGTEWQWSNSSTGRKHNNGYFVNGRCSTLFGDGHYSALSPFDIPGGPLSLGLRSDQVNGSTASSEAQERRLFWFGYSADYTGAND
jgi:prepilin-type N-terminal cleavage/methylation domain-containing protein